VKSHVLLSGRGHVTWDTKESVCREFKSLQARFNIQAETAGELVADETDGDGRLLAGLCYLPFFLINIVAILYVLLSKKGGGYAKYHALQALLVFITIFVVSAILEIPVMFIFFSTWMGFWTSPQGSATGFSRMFLFMIPLMIFSVAMLLVYLYFAYLAYSGKRFRIPLISSFVDRMV
jgi:uncharacterized membrane protein